MDSNWLILMRNKKTNKIDWDVDYGSVPNLINKFYFDFFLFEQSLLKINFTSTEFKQIVLSLKLEEVIP